MFLKHVKSGIRDGYLPQLAFDSILHWMRPSEIHCSRSPLENEMVKKKRKIYDVVGDDDQRYDY